MGKLFDNLYSYEIVLLFLGVFLFILLCAGLVYVTIKKGDLKKLLLFFPIPIIMVAYPGIQELQIENNKFALKKFSDKIIENPNDTIVQNALLKVIEELEKRVTTTKDFETVGLANLLLGNSEKVIDLINKALKKVAEEINTNSTVNASDTNAEEETGTVNFMMLKSIKELAETQIEFQKNPEALKDTIKLKEQIDQILWKNPKTGAYLYKKIVEKHRSTTLSNGVTEENL